MGAFLFGFVVGIFATLLVLCLLYVYEQLYGGPWLR